VTLLLSRPMLNEWGSVVFKLCMCGGSQSDTHHNVSKGECYYRVKKHFRKYLILPELLSDNLSDVPVDIFQ
jgi:hypothetical protein